MSQYQQDLDAIKNYVNSMATPGTRSILNMPLE